MTLRLIGSVLLILCAFGAFVAWRSAPAVSVALVAAVVAGAVSYRLAWADGPRGVPKAVADAFSVGLVVGGVIGKVFTRRRRPGSWEWPAIRTALWLLAATPFLAVVLLLAIQGACPLYVTHGSGMCFYDVDVMGGWSSQVTFLFVLDMLIVVCLLWFAPGPKTLEPGDLGGRALLQGPGRQFH